MYFLQPQDTEINTTGEGEFVLRKKVEKLAFETIFLKVRFDLLFYLPVMLCVTWSNHCYMPLSLFTFGPLMSYDLLTTVTFLACAVQVVFAPAIYYI